MTSSSRVPGTDVDVVGVVGVRHRRLVDVLVDRAPEHDVEDLHPPTDGEHRQPRGRGRAGQRDVRGVLLGRGVHLARVDVGHPERSQVQVVAALQDEGVGAGHQVVGAVLVVRPGQDGLTSGPHHRVHHLQGGEHAGPLAPLDDPGIPG